jgi:hypothetical protein
MNDPETPPVPANAAAAAIVDAIRELNRHIEHQRWSSNCAAISDRAKLVDALIAMPKQSNAELEGAR